MLASPLLERLNEAQQQAVSAPLSHALVIAGAGSGKTRVLVQRIAWLIQEEGISPHQIFAVTFTNKAAYEMRGRIEQLLGTSVHNLWIGTFHSLAHRFLRLHADAAGLPEGFQILDSDDQLRIVKRVHRSMNLDEEKWPAKQSRWFINQQKDEGKRGSDVPDDANVFHQTQIKVYAAYESLCKTSGLVDFAELLLRTYELLKNNDGLLKHYQNRFQHVLVDEFQDTNTIQYQWLRLLVGESAKIMAVGDDDQSIYGWRGAKIENMQHLKDDFPDMQLIRLEQNYRSTGTILKAANAIIAYNENRLGKELWTDGDSGALISSYAAFNEMDEARYITHQIQTHYSEGICYAQMAILYRSNAQSRILEEQCLQMGIPYRIYGGQKFFERAEIKDALAYLRLIANRFDDSAFERVVNTPTRGIGQTTLTTLREKARDMSQSLWDTALYLTQQQGLPQRASTAFSAFLGLINHLDEETQGMPLDQQTDYVLQKSGLFAHYQKDRTEKGRARVENLEELISATDEFKTEAEEGLSPLQAFLVQATLEAGSEGVDETDNVQLMTLHSAKGLEFPIVFLSGLEEGLFPHTLSAQSPDQLEEERRLCYVGMTRAMKKLYVSYSESRRLHGFEKTRRPSRFLAEMPADCIQEVRTGSRKSFSQSRSSNAYRASSIDQSIGESQFQIGQTVHHVKFGQGVILNYEGSGEHLRLQVRFKGWGVKWLVAQFAQLT